MALNMKIGKRTAQSGFTYFGLLVAIATVALGVGTGAGMLSNDVRRDKELDLLFAGDAIRRALDSYHAKNSGGVNPFPRQLEWLLRDPGQPTVQRYLRKIFRDPMHVENQSGALKISGTWVLIFNPEGQIVGVRSNSTDIPLKKSGFPPPYENFKLAKSYADWQFMATGAVAVPAQTGGQPGNFIPTPFAPSVPLVPAGGNPLAQGASPGVLGARAQPSAPVANPQTSTPQVPILEQPAAPAASSTAASTQQVTDPGPPPSATPVVASPPTTPPAPAPSDAAVATPAPTAPAPAPAAVPQPPTVGASPQPFIFRAPKDF